MDIGASLASQPPVRPEAVNIASTAVRKIQDIGLSEMLTANMARGVYPE
jgi:hypothetical protein